MGVEEIRLRPGRQRNTSVGSFGVIFVDAREGHPLTVRLGVATGETAEEERRYLLHPGDTFPVGDRTWRLERVENPTTRDWTVVLTEAG